MTTPSDPKRTDEPGHDASETSGVPWFDLLAASWSPGSVRQHSMSFGDDPDQTVIAFIPKEAQPGPWAYFLFGGGWTNGSPRLWSWAGNWFAHHGVPAVLGGYRLAPDHVFPEQLDDALAGFSFALAHAEELGIEGRPAVLAGASAGGHLVALSALQLARDALKPAAGDLHVRADALLLVNAPLDFPTAHTPEGKGAIEVFTGHKPPWPEADALTWVTAQPLSAEAIPPTILIQGEVDELVAPISAEHFAAAVNALAPGRAEVVHAPWQEHADLTRLFLDKDPELSAHVIDWLRSVPHPRS